jgi:uncharacterized protein (DUF1697 family)
MPTYAALLRGINVGGHNKVPMIQLKAVIESLGHTDVTTYIQSGNVVFTSRKNVTPAALGRAIKDEFGFDITVVLRTSSELQRVVTDNPFARADLKTVHVGFMASKPSAVAVRALDADQFAPEEFAIKGSNLYLHLPNGMGRTKLPAYLDRKLKVPTTVRNWNTVLKLLELTAG